ncbi:MAG: 4a-hydroxytetrahydrobiopterin dehydratase [Alphaproteobacteria bacterium CG11_big_fil_rev_8_21_14_0_20_44_7]|nr:MAG: 4a-hydroxytetrahydrobiopterin dehydratase [Alphaproteobacteria bacterium CG11_big_fil_rev_8_21_14_0_20_44_7]
MGVLAQNIIDEKLAELEEWGSDGKSISKRFEFKNFAQSLEFVNKVGAIAEDSNHHPDIEFGWGYALITFTSHDAGGLTEKDFAAAERVEGI